MSKFSCSLITENDMWLVCFAQDLQSYTNAINFPLTQNDSFETKGLPVFFHTQNKAWCQPEGLLFGLVDTFDSSMYVKDITWLQLAGPIILLAVKVLTFQYPAPLRRVIVFINRRCPTSIPDTLPLPRHQVCIHPHYAHVGPLSTGNVKSLTSDSNNLTCQTIMQSH